MVGNRRRRCAALQMSVFDEFSASGGKTSCRRNSGFRVFQIPDSMKDYFEAKILIIEMSRKDISQHQKFLQQMDKSLPSLLMDVWPQVMPCVNV